MPEYRRYYCKQPVFVTVVTHRRQRLFSEEAQVGLLLTAMRRVKEKHPFRHYAHAILPDHLHWLFETEGGPDFSKVVAAVKREFTWRIKDMMARGGHSVQSPLEPHADITLPLWQNRFYDHLIRDANDFERHLAYIHFNPVKHGLSKQPQAYPHTSFAEWRKRGAYPDGWGEMEPATIKDMSLE